MKKLRSMIYPVLLMLMTALSVHGQQIPAKPNPPHLVNDLAHAMTAEQVSSLEKKLDAYDDSSSIQIAVVTMASIGDDEIGDVALGILRNWGVGNKKTNNGVVVLAAIKEHKVYIATGYGMEGVLPDITAKSIIDNEIVPNFKAGGIENYYRGFNQAADAIIKASKGEYKAPQGYAQRGKQHSNGNGGNIIGFFVILFVILIVIFGRGRGGGGGGGGLFGGSGILPFMLGSMLGSSSRGWGNSGGGGWSGGGGGGGFGGFGGGSGGGGGAGGSW